MSLSYNSLTPILKDAFSSVAIAVRIDVQIAVQNSSFKHNPAALNCILANTIAPPGWAHGHQ